MRKKIIEFISKVSGEADAFYLLEQSAGKITRDELRENIIECGILPEMFPHDSSTEKLWAKYSDIILAHTLGFLGIPSEVLRVRGNSADVFGKNAEYSIVGDAKTFRLSRTAKNQKDFKVKSLDDWRKKDNYVVLAAPLIQYPSRKSQIYAQAIDKNITLLSYTHLSFLLEYHHGQDIRPLWETSERLRTSLKTAEHENSASYWKEIDRTVCRITDKLHEDLRRHKESEIVRSKQLGNEGIAYWRGIIRKYKNLSKEEAIARLIKAEKIESKIRTIEETINQTVEL
ncbi:MAG: HindIII family type II restriction endonuclease [Deltaproteobacteria bacterium]|nr:HindIII family type II restriction endonuclease [Deltaproteobacteria bacterium]